MCSRGIPFQEITVSVQVWNVRSGTGLYFYQNAAGMEALFGGLITEESGNTVSSRGSAAVII